MHNLAISEFMKVSRQLSLHASGWEVRPCGAIRADGRAICLYCGIGDDVRPHLAMVDLRGGVGDGVG